jgi:hypothetical protein
VQLAVVPSLKEASLFLLWTLRPPDKQMQRNQSKATTREREQLQHSPLAFPTSTASAPKAAPRPFQE